MKRIIFALSAVLILATCKKEKNQNQPPAQQPTGPITYSVKYHGNGSTYGSVPIDGHAYTNGQKAAVLGNIGNLYRSGYTMYGWTMDSLGNGLSYGAGDSIAIPGANIKFYAKWIANNQNPASENSSLNCGGAGWVNPSCASSGSLELKGISGSVEVILTFNLIPSTGSYNVSSVSGPSNVFFTVKNPPGQPSGITWYGKTGVVSVNSSTAGITASFSGVQCVQANYNFPVVSVTGSVACY